MVYSINDKNCFSGNAPIKAQLKEAKTKFLNTKITHLAEKLILGAERLERSKMRKLKLNQALTKAGVSRNYNAPKFINLARPKQGTDDLDNPLTPGEKWNEPGTRRATLGGVKFGLDQNNTPVNPYTKTGLCGPGVLWRLGPNIAVDNGIIRLKHNKAGEIKAHALGILRKFDNNTPALAGGFAKFLKTANGSYLFNKQASLNSRVDEFFEEMVSGSIKLIPSYQVQLDPSLKGHKLEQAEVALKMQQVRSMDKGFWRRLTKVVHDARLCYEGPVINANRNTDNSWIETSLSWFTLSEETWDYIKGSDPSGFGYDLKAGDDASGIIDLEINEDLLKKASGSHSAYFTYMSASFLLDSQEKGLELEPSILTQMQTLVDYLNQIKPNADKDNCSKKQNKPIQPL